MKATELKIGNHVRWRGNIVEITELFDTGCTVQKYDHSINTGVNYNSLEPITLTDRILRDWCGFVTSDIHDGLEKYDVIIERACNSYLDHFYGCKITAIHQLQNFIYAVTGHELAVHH